MAVSWGRSFGTVQTTNLVDNNRCRLNTGLPVCCAIWNESEPRSAYRFGGRSVGCVTERVYVPSAFEVLQLEKAQFFDNITDFRLRKQTVIEYITSERDLNDSYSWMTGVKRHMRSPSTSLFTEEELRLDEHYLSYFRVTQKCPHHALHTWIEWIEPLTIHARNPFSLLGCVKIKSANLAKRYPLFAPFIQAATILNGIYNTDHILLHPMAEKMHRGNHKSNSRGQGKNYFFDAGTSSFESSMWWFTCMYNQRNITFDSLYGWEFTLLEPAKFWEEVPSLMRPKYHFYNIKMSSDPLDGNSPLRMIRQIAGEQDFVSFKLDIDTPSVEIPTVLEILKDESLQRLIGEFFFELHFRCEIMMYCGWGEGNKVPEESFGVKLHRWNVLDLFQQLRKAGVRSHFWP